MPVPAIRLRLKFFKKMNLKFGMDSALMVFA